MNAEKQLNQEQQMVPSPAEALPAEKPVGFVQATKDFFGNALNTVKGKDLSTLVEEFSSEMTLVAEGLSEDQAKLHELCQSVAAQQTVDREELDQTIRQAAEDRRTDRKESGRKEKEQDGYAFRHYPPADRAGGRGRRSVDHRDDPEAYRGVRPLADYETLVKKYKKRSKDNLVDKVALGLSCAENVTADAGLLTDTGLSQELLDTAGTVLPFAVIAVTEEMKVILGKKDQKTGLTDAAYRMVKTGAAMTAGAAAMTVGGPIAGVSAALGVRAFLDRYKSKALTSVRLKYRIDRLRALRQLNAARLEMGLSPEEGAL